MRGYFRCVPVKRKELLQYNLRSVKAYLLREDLLAMRKAYGCKSYEPIEIALYHQLGRRPEPDQTHRFC